MANVNRGIRGDPHKCEAGEAMVTCQVLVLRAGLVPSMTHDAFVKLLLGVSGVESAECE